MRSVGRGERIVGCWEERGGPSAALGASDTAGGAPSEGRVVGGDLVLLLEDLPAPSFQGGLPVAVWGGLVWLRSEGNALGRSEVAFSSAFLRALRSGAITQVAG